MLFRSLSLISVVASALAQSFTDKSTGTSITYQGYSDPFWNITVGFSLPQNPNTTEFIGFIQFPASYSYAGISLGSEGMTNGLLLGAWGTGVGKPGVISPRFTTEYALPALYEGPEIQIIKTSTTNSSWTTVNFVCSNCTEWPGGSLDPTTTSAFMSFAVATQAAAVATPTNPNSTLEAHNPNDINFFTVDLSSAQTSEFNEVIEFLEKKNLLVHETL